MPEIKIIDKPKLKSLLRNVTELSFTGIMWGLWLYLFLPLLNLVLWLLGIRYFYIEVIEKAGYKELINLLGRLGWIILVVFLILRLWGYYNYRRFGKRDKRKSLPSNNADKEMAEYFQIPLDLVLDLQLSKEVVWPIQQDLKQDVANWMDKKRLTD